MSPRVYALSIVLSIMVASLWYGYQAYRVSVEVDEAITLVQLSGKGRITWPQGIRVNQEFKELLDAHAPFGYLADHLKKSDVHPPLYYLIANAWRVIFGTDILALRSLSILCVLIAGLILAATSRPLGYEISLFTILTFYAFPLTTWAAIIARNYGLGLLLICLFLFFAIQSFRDSRFGPHYILISGLIAGLAFTTHYFTLFLCVPVGLLLIYHHLRRSPLAIGGAISLFVFCAILILPILQQQFGARQAQLAGFQGISIETMALARMYITYLFAPGFQDNTYFIRFALSCCIFLLMTVVMIGQLRHQPDAQLHCAAFFGFGCLMIALFYGTDKSIDKVLGFVKYGVFLLPVIALMLTRTFYLLKQIKRIFAIGLALCCIFLFSMNLRSGKLAVEPWLSDMIVRNIGDKLMRAGNPNTLAIIPLSYGVGFPGFWVTNLPATTDLIVIRETGEFRDISSSITKWPAVIISPDKTGKLDHPLASLKSHLKSLGYQAKTPYLFIRP